jgi:hypothetical protein
MTTKTLVVVVVFPQTFGDAMNLNDNLAGKMC